MDVRIIAGVRNFLALSGEGVWRRCKRMRRKFLILDEGGLMGCLEMSRALKVRFLLGQ